MAIVTEIASCQRCGNCKANKNFYKPMICGAQSCYASHVIKNTKDPSGDIGKRSLRERFFVKQEFMHLCVFPKSA